MKIIDRQFRKPRRKPGPADTPAARQCAAQTLAGARCRLDAHTGSDFCLLHRNSRPPVAVA